MNASTPRPRVALIGVSGYGRIHLQLAREGRDRGELDIVAAAVINPEDEAENVAELSARGCDVHADYREMLRRHAGRIDLCLIPTGIHLHARMTVDALRAGANVLVEKPLAASMEEVRLIQAAERETGRFVAVGFQDCYDPGTAWLSGQLRAGAIGDVTSVRFLGVWPRPRSYFSRNDWAGRLRLGNDPVLDSPLNNAFGHFVMLSLLFAGADEGPVETDSVELFRAHAIESFDTGVVTLRTPQGVRLWFGASHASNVTLEPEILIEGSAGTCCWRYENEAWLRDSSGAVQRRPLGDQTAARRAMMTDVIRRLHDSSAPICTTAVAARHTALIEAIHRAADVCEFPAESIDWVGVNGAASAVPVVTGLDASLRRAFSELRPLRECGFPVQPVSAG